MYQFGVLVLWVVNEIDIDHLVKRIRGGLGMMAENENQSTTNSRCGFGVVLLERGLQNFQQKLDNSVVAEKLLPAFVAIQARDKGWGNDQVIGKRVKGTSSHGRKRRKNSRLTAIHRQT
jgi:hypothetical protein